MLEGENIPLFLSGHLHVQHFMRNNDIGIYEVVTSSLSTPPCQYGVLDYMEDETFYYYTRKVKFQSTPPRGWRQQYYTITTTILQHISTNKSYPTPSNHGQPSLHTRKSVLIVQIFRCESPRKSMFASGSHQNTLYRFTARGQVRISAVLPH